MKEYTFLFRSAPEEMAKLTEDGKKAYMDKWGLWFKKLTDDGHYENVGDRLISAEARTIKSSEKIVTDGPYAEAKEVIGGFIKVKAENLEEATELAKGCPIFTVNGSLEIRTSFYM
jgi:hypothetical protein